MVSFSFLNLQIFGVGDEVVGVFTRGPILKCTLGVKWNEKNEFSTCERLSGLEMVRRPTLMYLYVY